MFYKETEYAIRSLVYIQSQNYSDKRPGIAEISREIGAPSAYIAKILQRMVRQGFIRSHKGKNGGFYFDPGKPELTLKAIVHFSEGNHLFAGCGLGLNQCDERNPCPFHWQFVPIRNSIMQQLSEVTIQKLALRLSSGEQMNIGNFNIQEN